MQLHWLEIIQAGFLLALGAGLLIGSVYLGWHSTDHALRAYRRRRARREHMKRFV